ncbi:TOMM precursor leader peptide-binding protein [Streptomyces sp. NBC_01267]|uniref:TOMM precursor leader peptide-binding protein n=1 Tax=unclassified Streptomyces TaxID=2593676 RepID=UPI002023E563|nr:MULTISPECIES: TOMM precursor leader peptide-binding protein [unclassified Streptomyces]MCX4553327.1 TOMM precursor leader peptide-binding protein [Streptomyces sp. NBC_01500]WSC18289.1 TOMM precursor leader peptide-binding protein [Streptomyces sp. NBC_01766]WSV52331.1 TOMM precursor leader peptide-binding protein [Streptomyces sp. NBC_01014]
MTEAAGAPPAPGVAVLGRGRLAAAIRTSVSRTHRLVARPDADCAGIVTAYDGWRTGTAPDRTDTRWLPVRVELGNVVIGPSVVPGRAGCAQCARTRRDRALGPGSPRTELVRRFSGQLAERPAPLLSSWACDAVGDLVAAEFDDPPGRWTTNAVVLLSLTDMAVDAHPFLADPCCPRCGALPADRPPTLMAKPRTKLSRDTYRVRDLKADWDTLVKTYVDGHTGVVRQLDVRTDYRYPMVSAPVHLPGQEQEAGFGRDLDYAGCGRTALAEALERLGGARPGGHRTAVRAGYGDLGEWAVCPTTLGLYPPDRYAEPGFPYPPFDPDLELNWVWGHSFARDAPVLVPEDYAYYRTRHDNPLARPLAYEVSNGCALGGCLEEAALHGVAELAERDAFLLTWYARLPAPRVDLNTVSDPRIGMLAERIRQDSGHHVLAFATTPEHGIPTAWVMAVHPSPGLEPAAICAAGAHFDPEQALLNGVLELAANLGWNRFAYRDELARIEAMVADPSLVREMRDHALLYCHPAAFDRFGFLLEDDVGRPVAEAFGRATCRPRGDDIRADLAEVVARFTDRGQDVIVVDQTTDEHRAGGLACAKVIIPGLLPMTFGHRMRRTHGLPRLSQLPGDLGYRAGPMPLADINPHPHPFP